MRELNDLLFRAALTLALGLIVGFQRERKISTLAGVRTFPLMALVGFFAALLDSANGQSNWCVAAGLVALGALLVFGSLKDTQGSGGLTTEMAALLVYLLGAAFVIVEPIALVVVAGGVCALLLYLKESMHRLVRAMNSGEVQSIMQFVLVAFVILPLLPNEAYDTYVVLNPRRIWLMVVLINGISLMSFMIQKIKGPESGALWGGVLGGLISSTASTVTFSRTSARFPQRRTLVPAAIIASTVALIRVQVEILLVSPKTFQAVVLPLSGLLLFMTALSFYTYKKTTASPPEPLDGQSTPSELKAALVFGFLFAVILFLSAWTRARYGEGGLYVVSLISGIIDVDAVTLSTSQLMDHGSVTPATGWKIILTAFLSNLVFKSAIVMVLARGPLRKQVSIALLLSTLVGAAIIFLG